MPTKLCIATQHTYCICSRQQLTDSRQPILYEQAKHFSSTSFAFSPLFLALWVLKNGTLEMAHFYSLTTTSTDIPNLTQHPSGRMSLCGINVIHSRWFCNKSIVGKNMYWCSSEIKFTKNSELKCGGKLLKSSWKSQKKPHIHYNINAIQIVSSSKLFFTVIFTELKWNVLLLFSVH